MQNFNILASLCSWAGLLNLNRNLVKNTEDRPYIYINMTKLYKCNIEDIQFFGMNMPFISSSEAKNAYFMCGKATNEIYIFLLHEMKLMAYLLQKF